MLYTALHTLWGARWVPARGRPHNRFVAEIPLQYVRRARRRAQKQLTLATAGDDASVEKGLAWYQLQAEKPVFLAVELLLGLGFLALLDGGFTGDWYKYDLVTGEQQTLLTRAAILGTVTHAGMAVFAASVARNDGQALLSIGLALVKGFLFGVPELILNIAKSRLKESS